MPALLNVSAEPPGRTRNIGDGASLSGNSSAVVQIMNNSKL